MNLKEDIVQWALYDRSFEAGCDLFRKFSRHEGLKRKFALQGETKENTEALHYQLSKLAGISESDWRKMMRTPVVEMDTTDYADQKVRTDLLAEVPEDVRKAFRLRDEFPILKEKVCPAELKILVADLLTTHDKYVADHDKLFSATTPEEIAALSESVVENYLENRQIWDELNYYKKEGKPLGQHPVWKRTARLEELRAMSSADLVKLSKNIPTNISRITRKLEEDPESKETQNRQVSLENYKWEFDEVNKLLQEK